MTIRCGMNEEAWSPGVMQGQDLLTGNAFNNGLRYDTVKDVVWTHPHEGGWISGNDGTPATEATNILYVDPSVNSAWGYITPTNWVTNNGTRNMTIIPWMSAKIHAEIMMSTFHSVGARVFLDSVPTQDVTLPGGTNIPENAWGASGAAYVFSVAGSTVKIGGALHWMGLPATLAPGASRAIQAQPIQLRHSGNWDTTILRYRWCDYLRVGWIAIRHGVMV